MTTCDGKMTYEEFEWHILRLVYEEGLEKLQPSYLAYALGLPHDRVTEFLERACRSGVLELEVRADGLLEYSVPGFERMDDLPQPIWREIEEQFALERPENASPPAGAEESDTPPAEQMTLRPSEPAKPLATDGRSGQPEYDPAAAHRLAIARHPQLPASLRRHIEAQYGHRDTSMIRLQDQSLILGTEATVEDPTSQAMIALDNDEQFPFRVEACNDTYCDPTQTVFMRQIRVHGVESERQLRFHVQRLFESFGYRVVQSEEERLRFERGSVTFILALVPLFVLVLPLFVYLFLYCMGRSTIHQEPVELDVQFRRLIENGEPVYEIDLTFIGLHGVVLGAADQRVLNQEIDTLRDELRWSLSPG